MFRINDYELTEAQLDLLRRANVEKSDGCLWYPNGKKDALQLPHNACTVYLYWHVANDYYGVQRIVLGAHRPIARGQWRKMLEGKHRAHILQRVASLKAVFVDRPLKWEILGWHPHTVKFWTPPAGTQVLCRENDAKASPRAVLEKNADGQA